jgi:phytanoyl-CoA hydroxylase
MKLCRKFSFLTSSQVGTYNQNGFLTLEGLISLKEIDEVKQRIFEHIEAWEPINHSIFRTKDYSNLANEYFIKSAFNISFFLEESLKFPITDKYRSLNKIGHALHDIDQVFRKFSYRPEYRSILTDLGYNNPKIVQSMYILKAPQIGGIVPPHQDSTFIISEPASCIGIWVALDDANSQNACMYAVPGSHKLGTQMRWGKKEEGKVSAKDYAYETKDSVCLEAKAGTVILLHGDLVHWSDQNFSDRFRHAYTIHVVEGDFTWSTENWIQRPSYFPFRNWV